jgi:hypothetical protein
MHVRARAEQNVQYRPDRLAESKTTMKTTRQIIIAGFAAGLFGVRQRDRYEDILDGVDGEYECMAALMADGVLLKLAK